MVCLSVQTENNLWKKKKEVLTAKEKLLQFFIYLFIYKNTQTLKTHRDETST